MKKNGFTIVELIAVIVILGLIGIIIVPTVNTTIEKQRKKAFMASVSGLLATVKSESQNSDFETKAYLFDTNKLYECDESGTNCSTTASITTDGKIKNGHGYVKVTKDGLIGIYIKNNDLCSFKTYFSDIITSGDMSYCDFGDTVTYILDKALYYNNDGLYREFSLNNETLSLTFQDSAVIDPPIEIESGFLTSINGNIEVSGINLYSTEIEGSSFCAKYSVYDETEVLNFYTHLCEDNPPIG